MGLSGTGSVRRRWTLLICIASSKTLLLLHTVFHTTDNCVVLVLNRRTALLLTVKWAELGKRVQR